VSVDRRARSVRVDVADEGGGAVVFRDPIPTEPTGRGLRIVEQLSDEWGVRE
jgi:serine/threonine-protein kinase RsbW